MQFWWQTIRETLKGHARELALVFGMIAVGVCGFEFGFVQGVRHTSPPIVIEKAVAATSTSGSAPESGTKSSADSVTSSASSLATPGTSAAPQLADCPFVGSKNSDKYHAAGCAVAKRIKPENRICFTSEEDAKAKNYKPSCLKP